MKDCCDKFAEMIEPETKSKNLGKSCNCNRCGKKFTLTRVAKAGISYMYWERGY